LVGDFRYHWLGIFVKNFLLIFADARPSPDEQEVFNQVAHVLSFAPGIITELKSYKGAVEEIRVVSNTAKFKNSLKA